MPDIEEAEPIRGWLVAYLVVLAVLSFHGLALTVASIIIHADPSVADLTEFVPLPALLVYIVTNVLLILYTIVLYALILRRKRSAIAHNVIFNVLSVVLLVAWHVLDMKSMLGTVVDSVPNILCCVYMLRSKRVRRTFRRGPGRRGTGHGCPEATRPRPTDEFRRRARSKVIGGDQMVGALTRPVVDLGRESRRPRRVVAGASGNAVAREPDARG